MSYEIRKWVHKPILKEVIETNLNFQALAEIIPALAENMNEEEFFNLYEIEDLETGKIYNEDFDL